MRDAAERIVGDGNSSVLYELARRVGNASASESRTESMNVVGVTMLNKPMHSQEVSVECVLRVNDDNDLFEEDERIDAIRVKNEVGNDPDIVEWNLELYPRLKELVVGDDCVWYVKGLKVSGFKSLVRVVIGSGCFSKTSGGCFEVRECDVLSSVVIGKESCGEWSGFVLRDCGRVAEVVIGERCFQLLREWRMSGLGSLEKVEIGMGCGCKKKGYFEMSDCARLRSVIIGGGCCVKWSSFVLRDCGVEEVSIGDGCFVSCEKSVFESECLVRS